MPTQTFALLHDITVEQIGEHLRDYLKIKDRNIIEQASWIMEK